ncbi:MAG: LysE family translocator [Candidatus Methylomirabilales bacterium]
MTATLAGFLFGFIGSMPVSGPISLLVFHRGLLARYRDGWAIGLGGAIVEGVYCALAIYGFSALVEGFTFFEPLAKAMAILVLLAIGLYFMFTTQEDRPESPKTEQSTSKWVGQFFVGFSVAALNPTLIFTWSVSAAMLYSLANLTFHTYELIAFATSVVFGIATWFGVLLALLRRFKGHFSLGVFQKVIRGIGVLLVATSVVMAAFALFR